MKKKMRDDDLELLSLEQIELELGGDIAERFSQQHLKGDESLEAQKARGHIWSALHEFGMALGCKDGTPARERFVATMNGPSCERFRSECRRYFPMVVRVLISEGFLPKPPPELSTLDVGTIKSLARAWDVMGRGTFFRTLKEFAKRWTDKKDSFFDRPLHVQNTLILQEWGSLRGAKNHNLAVAQRLAERKLLDLPAQVSKSRPGMRKRKSLSDIENESGLRAAREDALDRIRKRKERLMAPKRIKNLRAKFDLSKE